MFGTFWQFFVVTPTERAACSQKPHNREWSHCLPPLGRLLSDQLLARQPLVCNKAASSVKAWQHCSPTTHIRNLKRFNLCNEPQSTHATHETFCLAHVHPPPSPTCDSHLLVGSLLILISAFSKFHLDLMFMEHIKCTLIRISGTP